MENASLQKEIRGINTYTNVIDTEFTELITVTPPEQTTPFTVSDFFARYNNLFYDIPLTGINSHTTLVQKSTEYIGGSVIDEEKQALIEEINTLRQQLVELSETYITVGSITS
jgi:hypothetical protein